MIKTNLINKKNLLRRLGANPYGLDPLTSKLVAQTMTLSIAMNSSEVWQMSKTCPQIEVELNDIYRRILGVEKGTCMSAVRHELGVTNQKIRSEVASLKFRNHILGMSQERLPKRIYDELLNERKGRSQGHRNCGVKFNLELIAKKARWPDPITRFESKKLAKEYIEEQQNHEFADDMKNKSTLRHLGNLTDASNSTMADYLRSSCPVKLREGRRLKTKFRLGCYDLNYSTDRKAHVPSDNGKKCRCCVRGSAETMQHFIFECPAYNDSRDAFMDRMNQIFPEFMDMNKTEQLEHLLQDDTAPQIRLMSYRFFMDLFKKRRLVNLTAQGEGVRAQATLLE